MTTRLWPGSGPGAGESGLRPGDELVSVGSASLAGVGPVGFLARVFEQRESGRTVTVSYLRGGVPGEARLPLFASQIPPWFFLFVPAAHAILAIVVALRAPRAREARAVFRSYAAYAFIFLWWPGGPQIQTYAWLFVMTIAACVVFPLALRSFLLFPEETAPKRPWLRASPWAFALFGPSVTSWWFGVPLPHAVGFRAVMAFGAAFFIAAMAIVVINFRKGRAVARRQMRWRLYGAGLGMVPMLCVTALGVVNPEVPHFWTLFFGSLLAAVAAPIALTIAIVRHNVFDIDRLISATASYFILCVLAAESVFVLIPWIAELLSGALGIGHSTVQAGLTLGLAVLVVFAHRRLRPQIDRIFFPDQYAAEQGLQRLLVDLAACGDPRALLLLAAHRLDHLLDPEHAALHMLESGAYEPILIRGNVGLERFEATTALVSALRELERPMGADFGATGSRGGGGLSPFDRAALESLGASVVAPVRSGVTLVAFLSLGRKRSGDVYTRTDVSWMTIVANKLTGELRRLDYERQAEDQRTRQQALRRYVPGAVADQLDRGAELMTSERAVSVLFVDIRGYSAFSELRRAEEVFSVVSRYTEAVTGIVRRHGGSVVEFAGDGMMAVFGAPEDLPAKERAAVEAGYDILVAMVSLTEPGAEPLRVGVGIASGQACVGNVQGSDRLIWSVIGDTTNLASRLQSLTRELDADMVTDAATWRCAGAASAAFEPRPAVSIRGRSNPEDIYLFGRIPRATRS